LDLKPIVVVNKVDKDNCRPDEVQQDVYELMFNLNATDDQLGVCNSLWLFKIWLDEWRLEKNKLAILSTFSIQS